MKKLLLFLTVTCLLFAFDNAQAQDEITNIIAPDPIEGGTIEVVKVEYVASAQRDIVINLQSTLDYINYGSARVTVEAGSGSVNIDLTVSGAIPPAVDGYKIGAYIATVGGNWPGLHEFNLFDIDAIIAETQDVSINNGDVENTTAMFQDANNEDRWSIEGMWFSENNGSFFDATNSGLVLGEGRNSSQAIKSSVINANNISAGVVLSIGDVDISANGSGGYTFKFYAKSLTAPTARPFWIVCNALDQNGVDVTSATLTKIDNGGTVTWNGLQNGYLEQSVTVNIAKNTSGNDAMYLRLQIQHGKFNNSYLFDDFTLTGPKSTSTSIHNNKPADVNVNVYPNPASTKSIIKSETAISNVSLYSLSGKLVMNKQVESNEYTLDVSSFTKGLYILSVTNKKGTSTTKFVID